jgi:hypothetical protein
MRLEGRLARQTAGALPRVVATPLDSASEALIRYTRAAAPGCPCQYAAKGGGAD